MKILFVTPMLCYPGVPYAGEASIYKHMESLTARGHEVYVITGLRPGDEKRLPEIKGAYTILEAITVPWSTKALCADICGWLMRAGRGGLTFRKKAAIAVQHYSEKTGFDIIQVEHADMGAFIKHPPENTPIIISAVDVLFKPLYRQYVFSKGWKKAYYYFRYICKKKKELDLYRRFDFVFTWSHYDKVLLKKKSPDLNIFVTRPFVNMGTEKLSSVKREPATILFSGAMNRPANITACLYLYEQIFKRVQKEIGDVKLYIVGNAPPESIKSLVSKERNIVVTGYAKSLEPFFLKSTVFASPIFFGGGIIVKNLEAMARGLPVVTTPIGNEGSGATPGRDILTADDAETFSTKVIRLIRDRKHWEDMSKNGTQFMEQNYSWNQTVDRVESEYKRICRPD